MLILGVDPGTAATGYGLVRGDGGRFQLVECGVVRTGASQPLGDRLVEIFDGLCDVIARYKPDAVACENVFYGRNVRTTVTLGHARGVILLAAARQGIPVHEYAPTVVKKAIVGTGAATKEQVQFMVKHLLRLSAAPSPADAADGVAIALTCHMSISVERLAAAGNFR